MLIINYLLDITHGFIILLPIIMFFIPKIKNHHLFLLFIALLPHHWIFFNEQCLLTIISQYIGGVPKDVETTSGFSETYLYWFYEPLIYLFGWEPDSTGYDKIITLHWIINIILAWIYSFYY